MLFKHNNIRHYYKRTITMRALSWKFSA